MRVTSPVDAMLAYAEAEAENLICESLYVAAVLVVALVEVGELTGERVDAIIASPSPPVWPRASTSGRADWRPRERNAVKLLEELPEYPTRFGFH
jgi:hypothetical protein